MKNLSENGTRTGVKKGHVHNFPYVNVSPIVERTRKPSRSTNKALERQKSSPTYAVVPSHD